MARVILYLKEPERDALFNLAESQYRDPRAQAALIIRAELERLGLLACDSFGTNTTPSANVLGEESKQSAKAD